MVTDGVHVGQSDMSAAEVRRLVGPDRIIGVSAKSPEQAHKAEVRTGNTGPFFVLRLVPGTILPTSLSF